MKKKFLYLLVIIIALIVQTSVIPVFAGGKNSLDLVLMMVLAWAILDGFSDFLPWAIAIGIFYDLISLQNVGVHVLIFLGIVYMVSFFSKRLSIDMKGTGFIIIVLFIVAAICVNQVGLWLSTSGDVLSLKDLFRTLFSFKLFFLQILLNSIAFLFCYVFIRNLKKYFLFVS